MVELNRIYQGHALDILKSWPDAFIDCVITSPPYWGLRAYGTEPQIWDGAPNCQHIWIDNSYVRNNDQTAGEKQRTNTGSVGRDVPVKSGFCQSCNAWRGELGLEPTFDLFISHLCQIFDEVKRVLKPTGTCFVVMGDSYNGSGKAGNNPEYQARHTEFGKPSTHKARFGMPTKLVGYPTKSLCCIPDRFRIAMIDRGWVCRNEITWFKRNTMPSSASNRFTIDFEKIFFFTKSNTSQYWTNNKTGGIVGKQPPGTKGIEGADWDWEEVNGEIKKVSHWEGRDYYFEQQFESYAPASNVRYRQRGSGGTERKEPYKQNMSFHSIKRRSNDKDGLCVGGREYRMPPIGGVKQTEGNDNPTYSGNRPEWKQGRNMRCVWDITTQPFKGAHFAVFPPELPERCIKAGCPKEICKKCGKAREKIYQETGNLIGMGGFGSKTAVHQGVSPTSSLLTKKVKEKIATGYTDCGCNAGFEPGIVADIFMGSGTSAMVAKKLGRQWLGVELNPAYIEMANKRIAETVVEEKLWG